MSATGLPEKGCDVEERVFRKHLLDEWGVNNAILMHDAVKAAVEACENSVVPTSRYQLGAAIICEDGALYAASRVEAGRSTVAPELAAMAAMLGCNPAKVRIIAVAGCAQGREPELLLPNPACRDLVVLHSHSGRMSARLVLTKRDIERLPNKGEDFRTAARFAEEADSRESPYGLVPFNALPLGQPMPDPADADCGTVVQNIADFRGRRRRVQRKK